PVEPLFGALKPLSVSVMEVLPVPNPRYAKSSMVKGHSRPPPLWMRIEFSSIADADIRDECSVPLKAAAPFLSTYIAALVFDAAPALLGFLPAHSRNCPLEPDEPRMTLCVLPRFHST